MSFAWFSSVIHTEPSTPHTVGRAALEDDVLRLVFLGDPHRALHRAHGGAGGVAHFQRLVRGEAYCSLVQFDTHGVPAFLALAFDMRRMHACCAALKR